jgi:hypothetical protein
MRALIDQAMRDQQVTDRAQPYGHTERRLLATSSTATTPQIAPAGFTCS